MPNSVPDLKLQKPPFCNPNFNVKLSLTLNPKHAKPSTTKPKPKHNTDDRYKDHNDCKDNI